MDSNNNIQKAKPVPPFVRYCSAIIPTAFDDSLSYYEALCALWKWMQDNLVVVVNNNANVTEEYIRLTNELKEFVENYFDNLDVQEEINNKLDAMVEDGTFQQIIGTYLGIVTPKMFGAESGTNTDQSEAISDCLTYAFKNGIKNVYLDGDYFVDSNIAFTDKSDIVIKNGTIRVHETDEKLTAGFKPFEFTTCNNINFENVRIIETEPTIRTRNLYQGGIYFTGCTNCSVRGCYFENLHNGICFKTDNFKCVAENNEVMVDQHANQFAESAILSYGSDDIVIKNNTITGEYYDGTLSVYGTSLRNIVDGNIIRGIFDDNTLYLSEGITIDAGCEDTEVINNIISGQYYGIDNKNDSRNTLISNNTVSGCKVSITDRPGEENKLTFNCQIKNNQIIIEKAWDTSSMATNLFEGVYYYLGIYSSNRFSGDIKNNKITLWKSIDSNAVCGVMASGNTDSTSNTYASQFDICNNTMEFATGFGSNTSYAGTGSTGIFLRNIRKGSVLGNSLKVDTIGNSYTMITFAGTVMFMNIQNNTYLATSLDNHLFVDKLADTTVTDCVIINNLLKSCNGYFNLDSVTNVVEMPRFNIKGHQIAPATLTANTPATVATITPRYTGLTYVRIMGLRSSSGAKYIFGEYLLNIQNATVTVTEISESANGLTVSFEHGANNRNCDIKITSTSNISNFGELFICDAMTDQPLTYA